MIKKEDLLSSLGTFVLFYSLNLFSLVLLVKESNVVSISCYVIVWVINFSFLYHFSRDLHLVKIFPNRIKIGPLTLYYKEMVHVQWEEGEIGSSFNERQKKKPVKILTDIAYHYGNEDFMIHFFHIVIEMPDIIYIAQPLHNRNAFVQNIRNGWIEEWRWDGSQVPPEDWKPKKK